MMSITNNTSPEHSQHHPQRKASLDHPLHRAAKEGDLELLNLLIQKGEDVNLKDNFGSTPIHLACFNGKIDCIEKLLEVKGIELNCRDLFSRTPIFYAAK